MTRPPPEARFAARLAAAQALYQMEASEAGVETVIREFEEHRFGHMLEEVGARPDGAHFSRVVRGVIEHQSDIDRAIDGMLKPGWLLIRLDATVRAILRAGAFELMACPDIPPRVAVNEYLDVAHAFFSGDEPGFINGVLDGLAHRWRDDDLRRVSASDE